MSSALATLGVEAPAVPGGGGGGGGAGPSGIRIYFSMVADSTNGSHPTGAFVAGLDLSGVGVAQLSKNGGGYAARVGAAPTSIGGGDYYYELDATEADTPPSVLLKVVLAGYNEVHTEKDIGDPAQVSDVDSATTTVTTAIVNALTATTAAIAASQGAITTNTSTLVGAAVTTLAADVAALEPVIDGHTDTVGTTITAAIAAAQAALLSGLPPAVWSSVIGAGVTARQIMVGLFATLLGKALGLETETETFYGPDGVTVAVTGTLNDNGDRVVTLTLGAP